MRDVEETSERKNFYLNTFFKLESTHLLMKYVFFVFG